MNTEKKLKYLSDHGWVPRQYNVMNQTDVVWCFQFSDGFNTLESTLNMVEINRFEFKNLVMHCEYIDKRIKRKLERIGKWNLKEAR
ncbi:MAG: hypothetical protein K0S25_2004 [Bacillus sp. (in: firmicutes)]|jgi:hypothetical protein|nr:hypothetical protein [Bacillales bacterium]MDF2904366.1 hypothetical protein [Bacillus sp. (in: firmicutes)]